MISTLRSAGIIEFHSLGADPKHNLLMLGNDRYHVKGAKTDFVLFSDKVSRGYALKLMKYIQKTPSIGKVWKSNTLVNPNSRNELDIMIFQPNDEVLSKWHVKAKAKYDRQYAEYRREVERTNTYRPFTHQVEGIPSDNKTLERVQIAWWFFVGLVGVIYANLIRLMLITHHV